MKKSYKKMLILQIILFLILIFNSFVSNILTDYKLVLFLVVTLIAFKFLFGFEKDHHRYTKDIIFEVFVILVIYFILFYLLGIIIGLAKTNNYYNLDGIFNFILPLVLTIITKEYLRYVMAVKVEGSKILNVTTVLLFILIDVSNAIYYNGFTSYYDGFRFIALTLLPSISRNIACHYITIKTGYKPVIVYLLVTNLYQYLLPIIPNPNEYILSLVTLLLPIVLLVRVYNFFQNEKDEIIKREYHKKRIGSLIPAALIAIVAVYFTSGYFKYYAVAIASDSMFPKIKKGDIVIIEKFDGNFEDLEIGQVLAYRYGNVIVVHRLVNIVLDNGEYYFYTKGDANSSIDNYAIEEEMVIGTVSLKVPYIGLPTVWLNEI